MKIYTPENPLKVLMVGNSFSLSCRTYLPTMANSVPGCNLKLQVAYIGGCPLEEHVFEYGESAKDPEHKPYGDINLKPCTLQELLKEDAWDIISIQQASHLSWRPESYQPWADKLIAIIKETNPQAEIIVQETWSYNGGDPRFYEGEDSWHIDQTEMYNRLAANYRALAKEKGFRLVPTGLAVQFTREDHPKQLEMISNEQVEKFVYPDKLPQTDDAAGSCFWQENKEKNGYKLHFDRIHLNTYGEYLQACVWFGFLFNRPMKDITLDPTELTDKQRLAKYRACAEKALAQETK